MDSRELTQWRAWEAVNGPIGAERGDFHSANVAMTMVAAHAASHGSRKRFKLIDFLPFTLPWMKRRGEGDITTAEGFVAWANATQAAQSQRRKQKG